MTDPQFSCAADTARPAAPMSAGALSGVDPALQSVDMPGILSGRPIDLDGMRRRLPSRWSAFIRAHFRTSTEVGYFFNVDEKTARNWFNGTNEPRLSAFTALMTRCPQPARIVILNFLAEAA